MTEEGVAGDVVLKVADTLARVRGCVQPCILAACFCRRQAAALDEAFYAVPRSPRRSGRSTTPLTPELVGKIVKEWNTSKKARDIAAELGLSVPSLWKKIGLLRKAGIVGRRYRTSEKATMTERQKQVLDFIRSFWAERGFAPSYENIAKGVGMRSRGNVHRIVSLLEADGYITRRANRSRSVRVAEQPGA